MIEQLRELVDKGVLVASGDPETQVMSDEQRAVEHEHARLYEALKVAQERAELAGHDDMAAELRRMRSATAEHYAHRACRE